MAYLQMQNDGDFTAGPMITAEPANDDYSYWATLYEMLAFGYNEKDTTKSHTSAWLQHMNGVNRVTVTIERINNPDISPYMKQINNKPIWITNSWDTQAKSLTQTLTPTNHPYNGCWETFIEIK